EVDGVSVQVPGRFQPQWICGTLSGLPEHHARTSDHDFARTQLRFFGCGPRAGANPALLVVRRVSRRLVPQRARAVYAAGVYSVLHAAFPHRESARAIRSEPGDL